MSIGAGSPDDPPDENETFANLDESLDADDAVGGTSGPGPEGGRDLDTELTVDEEELEQAGANLDDPQRMSLLAGGMDDPDGTGPLPRLDLEAGWDVDPCRDEPDRRRPGRRRTARPEEAEGLGGYPGEASYSDADGDAVSDDTLLDVPEITIDPELEIIPVADLDDVPDDAPGPDSAAW